MGGVLGLIKGGGDNQFTWQRELSLVCQTNAIITNQVQLSSDIAELTKAFLFLCPHKVYVNLIYVANMILNNSIFMFIST